MSYIEGDSISKNRELYQEEDSMAEKEILIRFEECEKGGRPVSMWERITAGRTHQESVELAKERVAAVEKRQKGRKCTLLEVFKPIYP